MTRADRRGPRPVDLLPADTWPDVQRSDVPIAAIYAALIAQRLEEEGRRRLTPAAKKRGPSINSGLEQLARESGIPAATLRHTWAGKRWTSIETLAKLEAFLGEPVVSYDIAQRVLRRVDVAKRSLSNAH